MDPASHPDPNAPRSDAARDGDELFMPPNPDAPASPIIDGGAQGAEPIVIEKPGSWGKQLAQLVIIPAVIVGIAVGVALLFGKIAGTADSIDEHIRKLQQSDSGQGRNLPFGLQDPRYKDRMLEAYNIATLIPSVKDAAEKQRVSDELIKTLEKHVNDQEDLLQLYLLIAIGQLGQPGGLEPILSRLDSPHARAREGAIKGLLAWPERDEQRRAIPTLVRLLEDNDPVVRKVAAAAIGALAEPDDFGVKDGLRQAMKSEGLGRRETVWNAAVALACLGDDNGARYVAQVLLDRETLAKLPAGETGSDASRTLSRDEQDHVILTTLAGTIKMPQAIVWDKIQQLADKDTNRRVRSTAGQLLAAKKAEASKEGANKAEANKDE